MIGTVVVPAGIVIEETGAVKSAPSVALPASPRVTITSRPATGARTRSTVTLPALSTELWLAVAKETVARMSSSSIVTVCVAGAPRIAPLTFAMVSSIVSASSSRRSSKIVTSTVVCVIPAGIVSEAAGLAKSTPAVALPARSRSAVTGSPEGFERSTVSVVIPADSRTEELAAVNEIVGTVSSSRIVKVCVSAAPGVVFAGGIRVTINVSSSSSRKSSTTLTVRKLEVSPAGIVQGSGVIVRSAGIVAVPPIEVIRSIGSPLGAERVTSIKVLPEPSSTVVETAAKERTGGSSLSMIVIVWVRIAPITVPAGGVRVSSIVSSNSSRRSSVTTTAIVALSAPAGISTGIGEINASAASAVPPIATGTVRGRALATESSTVVTRLPTDSSIVSVAVEKETAGVISSSRIVTTSSVSRPSCAPVGGSSVRTIVSSPSSMRSSRIVISNVPPNAPAGIVSGFVGAA